MSERSPARSPGTAETMAFVLPKGCVDMGEANAAEVRRRYDAFLGWVHPLARSIGSSVEERQAAGVIRSFDVVELADVGLWLLHNRFVSVVGVIDRAPEPGRGWAVDRACVDIELPAHLDGWGPVVPSAAELNAELVDDVWGAVSVRARRSRTVTSPRPLQVLFNYWD